MFVCSAFVYLCVNLTVYLSRSPHSGTDRESPNNLEKPQHRKPPVKKPRLPQNRNKSLEVSGTCLHVFICVCVSLTWGWYLKELQHYEGRHKMTRKKNKLVLVEQLSRFCINAAQTSYKAWGGTQLDFRNLLSSIYLPSVTEPQRIRSLS